MLCARDVVRRPRRALRRREERIVSRGVDARCDAGVQSPEGNVWSRLDALFACLQTKQFKKKGHFLSWLRRNFGIWSVLAEGYLERTAISLGKFPFWG